LCTASITASLSFQSQTLFILSFQSQSLGGFFTSTMLLKSLGLLYLTGQALASPLALPQGTGTGADSCAADPLEQKTWTDLKIDEFLATAAKTYPRTKTNNVQSLAASFGAPNFFCGLEQSCNAGQPCLPIKLPAWYVLIKPFTPLLSFYESFTA
jgi:hypothetical protein